MTSSAHGVPLARTGLACNAASSAPVQFLSCEYADSLRVMSSQRPVFASPYDTLKLRQNLENDRDFPAVSMVHCADEMNRMLAKTIVKGSLSGVLLAWLTLPAHAQFTRHVDEANHFEAQVPEGWYPIQEALVDPLTQQMQKETANKQSRYVGGYSRSPEGELTLPYVLFQVTDGDMNRLSESGLIRVFNAEPLKQDVSDTLSHVLTNLDLEAAWDPLERQIIIPMAAEVPGIGSIRGVFVGRVGSHGIVQINCYASEFDAAMPAFREWIDGVQIDADHRWEPGRVGGVDLRGAGWTWLFCGIAGALGALVYQHLRRSRR
jgi:hypothetical protein